jgi:hypothetical protein
MVLPPKLVERLMLTRDEACRLLGLQTACAVNWGARCEPLAGAFVVLRLPGLPLMARRIASTSGLLTLRGASATDAHPNPVHVSSVLAVPWARVPQADVRDVLGELYATARATTTAAEARACLLRLQCWRQSVSSMSKLFGCAESDPIRVMYEIALAAVWSQQPEEDAAAHERTMACAEVPAALMADAWLKRRLCSEEDERTRGALADAVCWLLSGGTPDGCVQTVQIETSFFLAYPRLFHVDDALNVRVTAFGHARGEALRQAPERLSTAAVVRLCGRPPLRVHRNPEGPHPRHHGRLG